jgi:hypothetical protein|nr:MAG TPA: exonuclease [Caudoviricetes sp.]
MGRVIPSVTQCIKLILGDKYSDVPKSILRKAAIYGTRVHKILEDLEDGIEYRNLNIYEQNAVNQYKKIKDFETVEKEIFVNYKTVYCGRVDGIGKNIIYDIKTTTKLDVDYISLQLSLYLLAYDEDNYENYTGYVLWLPKRDVGKKIEIPLKTKEEILDIVELIKCLC